jgi:hypothetical protein
MSPPQSAASRRRAPAPGDDLVLSELNSGTVVDRLGADGEPIHVLTFGSIREACPNCRSGQLKLVLRQSAVRVAHLFCTNCATCYDAHYANGTPALTI